MLIIPKVVRGNELMDNMFKFLRVQSTLVIPYPQVTEKKL